MSRTTVPIGIAHLTLLRLAPPELVTVAAEAGYDFVGIRVKAVTDGERQYLERYLTGRFLPDKAIDVMDEAGARARIGAMTRPPDVKEIEKEIEEIRGRKGSAPSKRRTSKKLPHSAIREKQAKEKLERILTEWREQREEKEVVVTDDDIMHVVSKWTGVPLNRMEQAETREAAHDGRRPARQGDRPGRSGHRHLEGAAPHPRGSEGSAPPDWLVHLPRSDRCRQELPRADAGRIHVWRSRRAHPDRHVGVHGEVHRLAPDRLASGLRRLRRGRPALRGGAPSSVLGGALRRNRKSAPRRDASAAPDPGGGQNHRFVRPEDRFPQHDHHHDVEHRRGTDQEVRRRWASARPSRSASTNTT